MRYLVQLRRLEIELFLFGAFVRLWNCLTLALSILCSYVMDRFLPALAFEARIFPPRLFVSISRV